MLGSKLDGVSPGDIQRGVISDNIIGVDDIAK